MNIWGRVLKLAGWNVDITAPRRDKCVICVAPHTSNWDFILGLFAYKSLGREANFLMKSTWFFFPLNYILKALGGIPVYRDKTKGSLTDYVIDLFKKRDYVNLAVTPEGTRSRTEKWHTGFLYIAYGAKVPIHLGVIDYPDKDIVIKYEFIPSGDVEKDMASIKRFYDNYYDVGKYPEKFAL